MKPDVSRARVRHAWSRVPLGLIAAHAFALIALVLVLAIRLAPPARDIDDPRALDALVAWLAAWMALVVCREMRASLMTGLGLGSAGGAASTILLLLSVPLLWAAYAPVWDAPKEMVLPCLTVPVCAFLAAREPRPLVVTAACLLPLVALLLIAPVDRMWALTW